MISAFLSAGVPLLAGAMITSLSLSGPFDAQLPVEPAERVELIVREMQVGREAEEHRGALHRHWSMERLARNGLEGRAHVSLRSRFVRSEPSIEQSAPAIDRVQEPHRLSLPRR